MQVSPGQQGYDADHSQQFFQDRARAGERDAGRAERVVVGEPAALRRLFAQRVHRGSRAGQADGGDSDARQRRRRRVLRDDGHRHHRRVARSPTPTARDRYRLRSINDTMARKYWPNDSPIGKRFRFYTERDYREVVGVARTVKYVTLGEAPQAACVLSVATERKRRDGALRARQGRRRVGARPRAARDPAGRRERADSEPAARARRHRSIAVGGEARRRLARLSSAVWRSRWRASVCMA